MAKKRSSKKLTTEDLPPELIGITSIKLTSVRAENVLRITAFSLDMDEHGKVITLEGDNEAGKSSALKAIEMAIAGAGVIPADPIHGDHGEGQIIARFNIERPIDIEHPELGVEKFGQLVATRDFKRGQKPKLTVRIHGQKRSLASPQQIFEALIDPIALDPLQFQKMPDDQKQQILAEMVGLDLVPINAKRKGLFDERTAVNRDVKRLEAEHAATTFHEDAPKEEVSFADLTKKRDDVQAHNAAGAQLDKDAAEVARVLKAKRDEMASLKKQLLEVELEIEGGEQRDAELLAQISEFIPQDETKIIGQIEDADATNEKVRANAKHMETGTAFESEKSKADDLTEQIEQLDADKKQMLIDAESRLPVAGLGFSEDGVVTYKKKPFDQAGRSATAVISCAVSMELNAEKMLKVILIDDAEKMDGKTKRKIAEMGTAKDFLIVQAQVMPDAGPSEGAVVIVDGKVQK